MSGTYDYTCEINYIHENWHSRTKLLPFIGGGGTTSKQFHTSITVYGNSGI